MVWIKVDDKLPKEGDPCIYYFKHVGVWGGKYIGMTEWGPQFASLDGFLTGDVTHWMPLPLPPSQPKKEVLTMSEIKVGDEVVINFHNAQYTLCQRGIVKHLPVATGDSWIIEDEYGFTHYISEGCTISKCKDRHEVGSHKCH
jgi:hypothetical protein